MTNAMMSIEPPKQLYLARDPGPPPRTIRIVSEEPRRREIEMLPLRWRHPSLWTLLFGLIVIIFAAVYAGGDMWKLIRDPREDDMRLRSLVIFVALFLIGLVWCAWLYILRSVKIREVAGGIDIVEMGLFGPQTLHVKFDDASLGVEIFRARYTVEHRMYVQSNAKRVIFARGRNRDELIWVGGWVAKQFNMFFYAPPA